MLNQPSKQQGSSPNYLAPLVALAWTGDQLSRGQAQNGVNFNFQVKFDLEDQCQSPPKDGRTHGQTDAGNDNTRSPILTSGKNYWLH